MWEKGSSGELGVNKNFSFQQSKKDAIPLPAYEGNTQTSQKMGEGRKARSKCDRVAMGGSAERNGRTGLFRRAEKDRKGRNSLGDGGF